MRNFTKGTVRHRFELAWRILPDSISSVLKDYFVSVRSAPDLSEIRFWIPSGAFGPDMNGFVIRTEGQILGNRIGRFTLSAGQKKLIPILFRVPANLGQFRFISENGEIYDFVGESAEFVVAIYGANCPTRVRIRLDGGQDFKPKFELRYC